MRRCTAAKIGSLSRRLPKKAQRAKGKDAAGREQDLETVEVCASSVFQRTFARQGLVPPLLKKVLQEVEDPGPDGIVLNLRGQMLGDVFVEALCESHPKVLERAVEVQFGSNALTDKALAKLAKVLGAELKHLVGELGAMASPATHASSRDLKAG